ncbi:MAG TPA: Hsp20/alpha crystallin family protein [Saprospiraceae bacterium]|nr:Hsp20/alpha crystallin family protein [Saprospiraceae bacterium]
MPALMPSRWPTITNELFDTGFFPRLWDTNEFVGSDWATNVPSVNIAEDGQHFKIELAAPGLEKKDFKIAIENGMIMISAEKKEETKEERENYMRREFSYNKFTRSFRLPENCLTDKIDAKYENGVLRMLLPKKEVTMTKPLKEIKVS